MKPGRFTEEQIIAVLLSEATLYNWKAKYGGRGTSEAKWLRMLEDENRKLKKPLLETMLDNAALKELLPKKMIGPAAKREAVAHLRGVFQMSERRACGLVRSQGSRSSMIGRLRFWRTAYRSSARRPRISFWIA